MLNPVPYPGLNEPPFPIGDTMSFDWDARLSMDMIRNHTKTDDVPGVTDAQLKLYRNAAIESAEMYTGLLLSGQKTVTEPIEGPSNLKFGKMTYRVRLKYPVADGYVYLYGGTHPNDNATFMVAPGTRSINVPVKRNAIDLSNCCDPCSQHLPNGGMLVAYKAGFKCADDIPAGIILGLLQFLAWIVEHPGDELLTMRNRLDSRGGAGVYGTNTIALASGALELWRQYDSEAI